MLSESEAARIVEEGLRFPPFTITIRRDMVLESSASSRRPDWIFSIAWEGASRDFAVEYKNSGSMSTLRAAIVQAGSIAYANKSRDLLPLVLVPFLRPQALDELVREKMSGLDLCGNGVLFAPRAWCAYRSGEKNLYPETVPVRSPYRGDQSLVARALLTREEFRTQTEIVEYLGEYGIVASTVSKVLRALEEDLIVSRKPIIRLERRDELIDRLRENFTPLKARSAKRLRVELTNPTKERLADNASRAKIWYAVSAPERYTMLPSSSGTQRVLTSDATRLIEGVSYQEDERFPTIELVETDSKLPFFDRRFEEGTWWTSPLQEYLQLANGGKREEQAAAAIRASFLAKKAG